MHGGSILAGPGGTLGVCGSFRFLSVNASNTQILVLSIDDAICDEMKLMGDVSDGCMSG